MTDKTTKDGVLGAEGLDDLNRRMQMAENRLNAVRSHRLNRQHDPDPSLSYLNQPGTEA